MNSRTRALRLTILAALLLVVALAPSASATGPIGTCSSGVAMTWGGGGVGIPFNPDQGDLGPVDHAAAVAAVQAAVRRAGVPFRQRPSPIPTQGSLVSTWTSRTSVPSSTPWRRTASRPSSSTTPARSSTCSSARAPASSASPAPNGSTRSPATSWKACRSSTARPSVTPPRRSTCWSTSSATTRTWRTPRSTARSCLPATTAVRRRTTPSRSRRSTA